MTEATMNSKPAVQLNRHFQKSVRIDCDLQSAQALEGYVSQPSCLNLLQIMSRAMAEERNSAFTWTGPYGSGKSSLALVFSALLSPRRDLQHKAKELLHLDGSAQDYVSKVFCSRRRWQVIDLVGTDRPLREALLEALINRNLAKEGDDPLQALREHTDARHGIAVIIDEMGAFLLNALRRNSMMFVQELAETAARSHGALMVTGILHQSFDAYVSGLS